MTIIDLFESTAQTNAPIASTPQLLTIPSRFDIHQVPLFDNIINNMIEARPPFILVDAQEVMHVDQAGINALLQASDRAYAAGARFRVVSSTTLRVALELVLDVPDASILFGNEILGQAA